MKKFALIMISLIISGMSFAQTPAGPRSLILTDYNAPFYFENLEDSILIQSSDSPGFSEPDFDDSDWITTQAPLSWEEIYPDEKGICWYRIHIEFPEELPEASLGLSLGEIYYADETYFNGHLIGGKGSFEGQLNQANEVPRYYEIPTKYINPGEDNVIAVRVQGGHHLGSGLRMGNYYINNYYDMMTGIFVDELNKLILIVAYLVISVYFLLFYIRRPKEQENLYFGLFTFFLALYSFFRTKFCFILFDNYTFMKMLEYMSLFTLVPFFTAFSLFFFKQKHSIPLFIFYGLSAIAIILVPVINSPAFWNQLNHFAMQPLWLFGIGYSFWALFKSIKNNWEPRVILVSFIVLVISSVNDVLVSYEIIDTPLLLTYGFFTLIVCIALVLANRFVILHNKVEDLNVNLEKKVHDRTEQVRKLLEQQNGDYFLTSLLIEPLVANTVSAESINVDFYINQKKKFKFRKWESQIGGDICISHSITLRGNKYTAFTNSDAMGKSMQGAGGALVLGVLFNSFIERTRKIESFQNQKPDEWLQLCYDEMEAVFEEFDGSMLISGVFGLIEDGTGLMYYFNAEHPWIGLYRNKKAEFVGHKETIGRKIGTIGFSGVYIQHFQLQPGDILFLGSDGRDDLLLGTDKITGQRIINEDETLFLKHIEKNNGNLKMIAQSIESAGALTDDFTLIRIEYFGEVYIMPDINPLDEKSIEIDQNMDTEVANKFKELENKKKKANQLYQSKKYEEAVSLLDSIKNEFNRSKDSFQVYSLLGFCHFKQQHYREALNSWMEALKFEPENPVINKNINNLKSYLIDEKGDS